MKEKPERGYYDIAARNVPGIQEELLNGKVAVAGLGGLGSNLAVMLARAGVGNLLLVDFDRVEPWNLNRQYYNTTHVGMYKTEALKKQIELINPYIHAEILTLRVTEENAAEIFREYPIICEAFDRAQNKAFLVNTMLEEGNKKIVAASGLNGLGSANQIRTRREFKNLYICGDSIEAAEEGIGFMAPRVMVCAGHQANMVLRLLLGKEDI